MSALKNKICIIDDNEAVCHSLQFLFHSIYDVPIEIYHNPVLFLEKFLPSYTGCLLIDLYMPCLNGIDLLKELRKCNCNMNIIIISGHATNDVAQKSIEAGADAFFSKPFKIEKLLNGLCKTGIDAIALKWSHENNIVTELYPADWSKHGLAGGPIRNREMAQNATALNGIYKKDKLGPGTKNMIEEATKKKLNIFIKKI